MRLSNARGYTMVTSRAVPPVSVCAGGAAAGEQVKRVLMVARMRLSLARDVSCPRVFLCSVSLRRVCASPPVGRRSASASLPGARTSEGSARARSTLTQLA